MNQLDSIDECKITICKDCNKCIRDAGEGQETHMCALCKEYVADCDDFISSDAIDVMSK